jgi:hypothetical protein
MMEVKFDNPPVHVTDHGTLYVKAEDIFHSKAGQEIIKRMAALSRELLAD